MTILEDMVDSATKMQQLQALLAKTGVLHARELRPLGIPQRYLGVLCDQGVLERVARGVYQTAAAPETPMLALAQVAKACPRGVICLLSALRFHGLGTQLPHQVWFAIERKAAPPRLARPAIRLFRFSGAAFRDGVEMHEIAGAAVRVYAPAKTIADCFKFRNKIGLDAALEALREGLGQHRCTMDELWRYAGICRVAQVMRPYLEALA